MHRDTASMHVEYSADDYSRLCKPEYMILVMKGTNYSCQSCRTVGNLVLYVQILDGRWQPPSNVLQSEAKTAPPHSQGLRSAKASTRDGGKVPCVGHNK